MKMKKIAVFIMAIALLATEFIAVKVPVSAAQATGVVISEDNVNLVVKPGETTHISLPIKAVGSTILMPEASLSDESGTFTFTKPSLLTSSKVVANSIPEYATTYVEFDVSVKETAKIGPYPVMLNITALDLDTMSYNPDPITLSFNLRILEEKTPTQLTIGKLNYNSLYPGAKRDISFNINNEGEIAARNVYISVDFSDTGLVAAYTTKKIKVGDIQPGNNQYITLPVEVLPTATPGQKTIKVNFEYKDLDGNKGDNESYDIHVTVSKNEKAPLIVIDSIDYGTTLKSGDEFILKASLANIGQSDAKNIAISIDPSSLGVDFIKNYYTDDIAVSNMATSSKKTAEIPLIVSKVSESGPKELKLKITYTDASGVPYSVTKSIYIDIVNDQPQPGKEASLIVSNVTQYPAKPVAGERMEVSFVLENRGTVDISELKILLSNLMSNTFIPVESEPYQYYELLEGGKSIKITIPLILSDTISEGLNYLGVKFEYRNGSPEEVSIPILNVQNDLGRSAVPKLIINDFSTDLDEIKAGSTFNFSYSIQNTHASMAARNIKVTISFEPDNIFALTQGSNTLYISNIAAGESVTNTIQLKAKTDAKTGPYPINIQMDYEYEGAKPNESGQVGTTEKAELKLQVTENARPVVDYVNVYSWDGNVTINTPATLAFEFYNMGKSDLYNVVATVEGDFTKSDGSMYVLGNVMPGGNAYAEFEVIPNIEGLARGVVKITFEDSNGDLVEFEKEFETSVMGEQIYEPFPGGDDSGEVFNPGPTVKKKILPLWLFIVINVVIFLAFIPITRGIIISIYKRKLRRREEEQY